MEGGGQRRGEELGTLRTDGVLQMWNSWHLGAGLGEEALSTQNIINQQLGQKTELWLQVQLPLPFPGPQPAWGGGRFMELTLGENVPGPSVLPCLIPQLPRTRVPILPSTAFPDTAPAPNSLSPSRRDGGCGRKRTPRRWPKTPACAPHEFCFMLLPRGSEDLLIPSWDSPKYLFFLAEHR